MCLLLLGIITIYIYDIVAKRIIKQNPGLVLTCKILVKFVPPGIIKVPLPLPSVLIVPVRLPLAKPLTDPE